MYLRTGRGLAAAHPLWISAELATIAGDVATRTSGAQARTLAIGD